MLKKRDQEVLGEMGEEHFLALILKENTEETRCKEKLKEYCQSLHAAGLKVENVDIKLMEYCDEKGKAKKDKCENLKDKIEAKCGEFKGKLDELKNNNYTEKNCTEYEPQCHFLEGACSDKLKEECSKLRNQCYGLKRNKVAKEVLLRALKGGLKKEEQNCKNKLEEECKILSGFSKELMRLCLDSKETCENLKEEAEKKCKSLEAKVKEAVENLKNETCHPLLEECHFYGPNCDSNTENKCDELRKKCEEKHDIVYIPPEEPWFPIQPRVSIIEEVGLEGLYKAVAQEGILINKLKLPSMEDLLLYLSQKSGDEKFDEDKCKAQEDNCDYLKTLSRHSNYNCTNIDEECKKLNNKLKDRRNDLKKDIKDVGLLNEDKHASNAEIISWHKLDPRFNGENCAELELECFYLDKNDKTDFEKACKNVRNMCYKKGLDAAAYETLESRMRGEFLDSRTNWPNQCQKKLIEVCKKLGENTNLLSLCLQPEETCYKLKWDIQKKANQLVRDLETVRDSPQEEDCKIYKKECDSLKEDNTWLFDPCYTLERNCYHLKESQNVRNLLLEERQNYFENIENCTSILDKKCQNWSRKVNKQFSLSCALQNDTCRIMTFNTSLQCDNLIKNINGKEIVDTLNKTNGDMDQLRELCPTWLPYCDALLPSCAKELAKEGNNDTLCPGIQKFCQPYQERQALEDEVLYKFRGNLNGTDRCNTRLKEHCATWTQKENTFSSLCNDTNGSSKNDKVKEELCERLVDRVKKLCKTLPKELEKEQEKLAKRIGVYDKLKEEAEQKATKTNVILTFSIENNTTNKTNTPSHALVKRSQSHPPITEKEAQAFDLVAIVLTEYVELKEKCRKLLLDCGFKVECPDSQTPCSDIEKKCKELKPLEMRPPEVTTSTTTITKNVTVDSEGKTICTSGAPSINMNCTSIHTTDTWVTHTSTHTSTMTKTSTITSKVTIVSTKKCQPTQCTTDRTHPTHSSGEEAGEVKPSGGIRVNGCVDIDLGREGVQMLKKRDQGGRAEEMGEDHFLALILKEKVQEHDCKTELGNYCKALHAAGLESGKVHNKLKDVCRDGKIKDEENKCKDLKKKIEEKCKELEDELNTLTQRPIENSNCTQYESQCLFLEGACSEDVIKKCSELRNECYETKRNKVADEIALRALKGSLKGEEEECKKKLKEHCPILGRMSRELMEKCLDSEKACQSLITEAEKKCASLTEKVKDELKDIKDETCKTLLEQCYFYGPNCDNDTENKCKKLRTMCEDEHIIVYTPPEEPWFPIQPVPDIADKVGLEELYNEAAKSGLLIEGLHTSMEDLLLYLSQKNNDNGEFDQQKCQEAHKTRCNYLKELSGDSSYDCAKINKKCEELKTKLQERRDKLEKDIQETNLFDGEGGDRDAKTIPWHKLYSDFYGKRCAELQSDCFFLNQYKNDLTPACDNVQAMCYKRGLNLAAYETLESRMRGVFNIFNTPDHECEKKLVEVCDKVKNRNHILLALCSDPKETCLSLFHDIRDKTGQLRDILEFKRDFPEDDCLELEARCYKLKQDDTFLLGQPCHTLEKNCWHLKELGEIERILLNEKKDHFQTIENCTTELDKQCNRWSRKVHKPFTLSCALQEDSCKRMTFNIYRYCDNLIKNINQSKIIDTLKDTENKIEKLEELCPTWLPYCNQLSSTCPETNQDDLNITLCKEIQKYCQPYQEREALENQVMYKLRGSLNDTNTCNTTLEKHCATWTQNDTFSSLCNDTNNSNKTDTQVKTELCQRLVDRVKKLCKKLPDKLKKENEELTKRIKVYDDLKNKTENATKGTNVILTFSIENNTTNKTNTTSHALVKRSERHPTITETEAQAFDLVAMVISEYVELEEKCKKLRLDCGFKECKDSKSPCSDIEKKCQELKPLEMRPPQTITKTITTATAETGAGGKSCSKTVTLSGNMTCGSVHTTDTWVTHTSTHTNTMTKTSTITSKVTIVSTKKCQPTQCTTDRTYPTHGSGGEEAGDVKPSEGMRIHGWGAKGVMCRPPDFSSYLVLDIDLGREGVQMLKKRDQEALGEMGEEHFLALILKEKVNKAQCKIQLGNYCKALHDAGLELEKVHGNLKEYCKNDGKANEDKCTGLEENIKNKCKILEKELKAALEKKPIENENCEKYEPKCLFLEGACPKELTEKCSELRNRCYLMKRMNIAVKVLIRALSGSLEGTVDQCKNELEKHCVHLASMSRELLWRCLNVEKTCENLVDVAKNKCDSLKTNLEEAVEKVKKVEKDKCHSLLEECHFYKLNCKEDDIQKNCNKLRTQCEDEYNIVYTPPEGPFIPIYPRVTIIEKVGLKELYQEMAKKGVLIEKIPFSIEDLGLFLSQEKDGEFNKTLCEKTFEKNFSQNAKIQSWHELKLEYISEHCEARRKDTDESKACQNVFAACYKRGVDGAAYETLESKMRGVLNIFKTQNYECENKLVEVCKEVKNQNYDLLALCLHPEETCDILKSDIGEKSGQLRNILEFTRDYPHEEDCIRFQSKCNALKQDSSLLSEPCHTLERNCRHLKELGEIESILLNEKKDHFQTIENCTTELDKQCNHWSRKVHKPFGLSCALQSDSCERMTFNINRYCENLIRNINQSNIVDTLKKANKNMEKLRKDCPTWLPYCNQLSSTCPEEVNQNDLNITLCQQIQTYCKPYQERQAVENAVLYEFRGNLTNRDQCMFKLESYCTFWEKMDNNTYNSLVSLCKDTSSNSNKNDTQVKEKLCERLLYRVKKLCKILPKELKKEQEELTKRIKVYNDLKNKAENATKGTNVILTFSIKNNSTNETNSTSHALVKRSQSYPTITKTEAEAFDLVAIVISEYVELKEKCKKLRLDCGFKECTGSQNTCKGIEKKCGELEPLKMRPPEVTTSTTTTTTTTTEKVTVDPQGKTICTAGTPSINMNCTSIHTTDTWVTHTSTHTSTKTQTSTITSKVTIVSTKKCQPTQCTTDRTHPTHGSGGEEAGDVKPSGGIRVNGWGTNLGREGVQMLKKRDQGVLEKMEEEHFLALILKDKTEDALCKEELKNFCESLNKAGLKSKEVHEKLEDYCEKGGKAKDEKCKNLKNEIEKKCTEFKGKLNTLQNNNYTEENCEEYEPQCHFLEGACSDVLKEECSKLRNQCYGLKRDKVAKEVLLRALKGGLTKHQCENKLKERCKRLSGFSKELMRLCLHSKGTCESLITKAEKKCKSLKTNVDEAVKDDKNNTCHPLLKQCHFYGPNCDSDTEDKCKELRTTCEDKHDIIYTPPEEPWTPIQPMPDTADKVGLEELYNEAAKLGLLIEGLRTSMEDLILYLSQKSGDEKFDIGECKKIDKNRCDYLKGLSGDSSYDCTNIDKECKKLDTKLKDRRNGLKKDIQATNLFDGKGGNTGKAEIIPWHELYPGFNGESCAELESQCFYLDKNGKTDFAKACQNVFAACYKKGIDAEAYETLESRMRGIFSSLTPDWLNQCQKKLIEVCEEVKTQDHDLLGLCLYPKKTCQLLNWDIQEKSNQLNRILDFKRDSPQEHDCLELEARCYKLKEDDTFLLGPCHTLEKNCHHLRESKQLKDLLLEEKKDHLQNVKNCTSALNAKCDNWSRKVHKKFKLSCALQDDTCEIIDFYITLHCDNLKKNINESKIVTKLTDSKGNMDELRKFCPRWVYYCDTLLQNCADKLAEEGNNDTLCPKIQELCQPYQTRQTLEDAVLYEFRGNLNATDRCNTTLEERCSTWTETKNDTFSSLCKKNSTYDSDKNDTQVKKELCERLVKKVRRWCKTLPNKLKEEKEKLTERIDVYNDLKKEAEGKANNTNVILTFSIKNNSTNETNSTPSHALVKRSEHHPTITEKEAEAFDLVAMVISEYVELKEKCEKLRLDCGFKVCPGSEIPCKEINDKCGELKPLEMKPPQTITNTETSTSTVTEKVIVDSEGKTICTPGTPSINMNCTSIHTTDTWVTHTSTHTSTKTQTSTFTSKVTIISTKKCQPTQCTTDRTYPTHGSGGEEAGEVKPSGGIRVNGWGAKGVVFMILLSMIYF
ncbi:hypothetical protein PCK1_000078 [Pneumocystis canis]|nr:hypothetical protein PCK1_000078 [Pneumocystis canis]